MIQRLVANWVYGGVLAGVLLLVLSPLLIGSWSTALALTFLHLPAYMLHQYEETDHRVPGRDKRDYPHRYNPGLGSAILLFLPLGALSLWQIQLACGGSLAFQMRGVLATLVVHAAIILHVRQEGIRLSNYFAGRP
jgi:hypothetical protein